MNKIISEIKIQLRKYLQLYRLSEAIKVRLDNLKEEIIISSLDLGYEKLIKENENDIAVNNQLLFRKNDKEFNVLMSIYENACSKVYEMINGVKKEYSIIFNKNIINHTTYRIKTPNSIMKKMQKKDLELNYKNLVDNINDIAGVRVVCPVKDDIYTMASIIEKVPNWNLISVKDYIKKPKKSGYSGYHMIVEVPVRISDFEVNKQFAIAENIGDGVNESMIEKIDNWKLKNQIFVKVEIQIRTMAMDFWATNEHKMKYKTDNKLSFWDSKRLVVYAKVINAIDNGFSRIGNFREAR